MNQCIAARLGAFLLVSLIAGNIPVMAHGGEDHVGQPPPTTASNKGIVTHTAKLGDLELVLKHPELAPDTASSGKLFLTDFRTNAPTEGATVTVEIEAAGGTTVPVGVEPTAEAGVFDLRIPALPAGVFTARVKVATKDLTDTATFAAFEVAPHQTVAAAGIFGWAWTLLAGALLFFVAGLLLFIVYLSLRTVIGRKSVTKVPSA